MKRQSKQNQIHYHDHYHYHYNNNFIQNDLPFNQHKSISLMRLKSAQAKPFYKGKITWKDHLNPQVSRIYKEINQTQSKRLFNLQHKDSFYKYKDEPSTLLCTMEQKTSRFSRDQFKNQKPVYQSQLNFQSQNNSFIPTTKSLINIQSKIKPKAVESKTDKVQSLIIKKTHSIITDKFIKQENLSATKNSDSIYQQEYFILQIQKEKVLKNEQKQETQKSKQEENNLSLFKEQQDVKKNYQSESQSSQQSWILYRYKLARQQSTYLRNRFIQQMQRNKPKTYNNINLY